MRKKNDLLDYVDALEAQVLETRGYVEGVRKPGRPPRNEDYQALKLRLLQFETVHQRAAAMLESLPTFKREAIDDRFEALRGRMVAMFLDETVRFLDALTERRDLPLAMATILAGHVDTIRNFRQMLRERGYGHFLEWATPEAVEGIDGMIEELSRRVPPIEDFARPPLLRLEAE